MLTKKDLASIKQLMSEQINGVKGEINGVKNEVKGLKEEIDGVKDEVKGLKEEIDGVKREVKGLKGEIDGVKDEVKGLKGEVNELKDRVDGMEGQISGLKGEIAEVKKEMVTKAEFHEVRRDVHEWREYSHNKFIMIENEVIPKISALYEMTDFYVKQMECRKYREQADKKMECVTPLKTVVQVHSEQLVKHDDMLERLLTGAV